MGSRIQITKEGGSNYRKRKEANGEIIKEGEKGLLYSKENEDAKSNNRDSKQRGGRTPILRTER